MGSARRRGVPSTTACSNLLDERNEIVVHFPLIRFREVDGADGRFSKRLLGAGWIQPPAMGWQEVSIRCDEYTRISRNINRWHHISRLMCCNFHYLFLPYSWQYNRCEPKNPMSNNHLHVTVHGRLEKNLIITMLLNFFITAIEVLGGVLSGSLSLLSDAIHNFSDGVAIVVSYAALRLSKKPRTLRHTFGLKRAELLAAIVNASTLIVISFFLIREAIERFGKPSEVSGGLMLSVASLGLVANVIGTLLLKKGAEGNLNLRAAYLHLLSDAISSLAVMVGALFIIGFNITWVDPALTILISLYILKETYDIVKQSVDVIMMSTPEEIDIKELQKGIEELPGVRNIHHLHIWRLSDKDIHFEAHIDVDDVPVSSTAELRTRIEALLYDEYAIAHTTLQFECDSCIKKGLV